MRSRVTLGEEHSSSRSLSWAPAARIESLDFLAGSRLPPSSRAKKWMRPSSIPCVGRHSASHAARVNRPPGGAPCPTSPAPLPLLALVPIAFAPGICHTSCLDALGLGVILRRRDEKRCSLRDEWPRSRPYGTSGCHDVPADKPAASRILDRIDRENFRNKMLGVSHAEEAPDLGATGAADRRRGALRRYLISSSARPRISGARDDPPPIDIQSPRSGPRPSPDRGDLAERPWYSDCRLVGRRRRDIRFVAFRSAGRRPPPAQA